MQKPTDKFMPQFIDSANETPCVVAGAGLVGSLTALLLARHGKRVRVIEHRSDPRVHGWAGGRSINLAISTRGLSALERVGLKEAALLESIRMPGRQIHPVQGEQVFQFYGTQTHHAIHSISRGRLNEILLEALAKEPLVEMLFETKITGYSEKGWSFSGPESVGNTGGAFVFGCDGGGSAVRKAMAEQGQVESDEQLLNYGYKELTIPADDSGQWKMKKEALHIWPRGRFMLIALPNLDGSYTVTLFLPLEGEESFSALTESTSIAGFFNKYFPDVMDLIPTLIDDFTTNPVGRMGTVRCAPWWSEKSHTLLLGDAAHAIVPFFGQGMNCGFEDCAFLDELLKESSTASFRDIAQRLFQARKLNADAIATMALENFVEMRDLVGDPRFLLQKEVEKKLERTFVGKYQSRYEMVSFSRIPYRIAWEAGEKQKVLLSKLCASLSKIEDLDMGLALELIESNLAGYFPYWEDKNGSWH